MDYAIYTIAIVLLILLSGFFSAAETAYSSISRLKFKTMAENKKKKYQWAGALGDNYDKLLTTILIGNNIVNIGAATLSTLLFTRLISDGNLAGTISTIAITIIVLFFGEVGPKTLAKRNPEPFALNSAFIILILFYILYPLNLILGSFQKMLTKIFKTQESQKISDEDLINYVDEAENSGEIDEDESDLIKSAIGFDDLTVEDALTPRVNVEGIDVRTSMEVAKQKFLETGYSRFPVYKGNIDNVIGILNEKDFYRGYEKGETKIRNVMSKNVIMLPPAMPLPDALEKLQKGKMHIAIVISEHGGTMGIITLEDVLEELVGEIWDEHDDIVEPVKKIDEETYQIQGDYNLDDFFELFEIDQDPDDYDPVKVSGFLAMLLEKAPVVGDEVDFENLHIKVDEVEFNRIVSCTVKILPKEEKEEENKDLLLRGLVGNSDDEEAED